MIELKDTFVVIDLRTKENVLKYIKENDVDIPDVDYFRYDLVQFKNSTGMSDEEVVNMLFDKIEDYGERYIESYSYVDSKGNHQKLYLDIGDVSYFKSNECMKKISEEEFYKGMASIKEFVNKIEEMNINSNVMYKIDSNAIYTVKELEKLKDTGIKFIEVEYDQL